MLLDVRPFGVTGRGAPASGFRSSAGVFCDMGAEAAVAGVRSVGRLVGFVAVVGNTGRVEMDDVFDFALQ